MDCIIDETGQLIIMRGDADIERKQYCRYTDNVCGDWCPHLVEAVNHVYSGNDGITVGTVVTSCAGHEMNLIKDRRKS